jgi:hypothetical protein
MNSLSLAISRLFFVSVCVSPSLALAFNSGSTGADGAFNPTVNTELELPPSGVFNFTTINVPTGVTVTFKKNATNTPVVWLASGNVTIAGVVSIVGKDSPSVGASGNGNLGDDGIPGVGGPGGYDGGRGGQVDAAEANRRGGAGLGPGAGTGGQSYNNGGTIYPFGGGGGGYSVAGASSESWNASTSFRAASGVGGSPYGSSVLLPLIGGSGGGGGAAGPNYGGSGGGGGGGAMLLASSGTVNITGSILAYGGTSGASSGVSSGATGGGGSGGAIRIVATTISGNGTVQATGRAAQDSTVVYYSNGGDGGDGRIRLEAEAITRTAATTPAYTTSIPGPLFIAGAPKLSIASVAGINAPANPTGNADINLPANTPNPVTVVLTTSGVPPGNVVKLTVTPATSAPIVVTSPALAGTNASASASVSVTLPSGPSVMSATTTYTIVASLGDAMSTYAEGERVEKIELVASLGGPSKMKLITVSGKEFPAPAAALALAGFNG